MTHINLELPPGVRTARGLQPFEFHWKNRGDNLYDWSLRARDGMGNVRFDRRMSGPSGFEFDDLPDLSEDPKLWEKFRLWRMSRDPRYSLIEAYTNVAFDYMIGRSTLRLSLKPDVRRGDIALRYAEDGSTKNIWVTSWPISEVLSCFSFDPDVVNWKARTHEIMETESQAD